MAYRVVPQIRHIRTVFYRETTQWIPPFSPRGLPSLEAMRLLSPMPRTSTLWCAKMRGSRRSCCRHWSEPANMAYGCQGLGPTCGLGDGGRNKKGDPANLPYPTLPYPHLPKANRPLELLVSLFWSILTRGPPRLDLEQFPHQQGTSPDSGWGERFVRFVPSRSSD